MPPNISEIREHLRRVHSAIPDSADALQAYIDQLEQTNELLTNQDAYRAFVLRLAQESGVTQSLLQRIDNSVLSKLATAAELDAQRRLTEELNRGQRQLTMRQVLSEPVVLAVIGLGSTALSGIATLLLRLLEVGAG